MFTPAGQKYWEGGDAVVLNCLADVTDDELNEASGMTPAIRTFWQRLVFSGRGKTQER